MKTGFDGFRALKGEDAGVSPPPCLGRKRRRLRLEASLRRVGGAAFADDRDLDFSGVVQLLLDGPRDVATDTHRVGVGGLVGAGNHS